MKINTVYVGPLQTCCYIVQGVNTGEALIVDPGYFDLTLEKVIDGLGIKKFKYILITHGHIDHICGASYIKEKYGGEIAIGQKDAFLLEKYDYPKLSPLYGQAYKPCKGDILLSDGDTLSFDGKEISVIHTPGHIPGEVCYIFEDVLFSGDLLFKNSIGSYSFEGGNIIMLVQSLKRVIDLGFDFRVLPGHGEETTLFTEKEHNPYLRKLQ